MSVVPFLAKEDPELPDSYSVEIHYLNGKKEKIDVASHKFIDMGKKYNHLGIFADKDKLRYDLVPSAVPFYEFVTKDDTILVVPIGAASFCFDKNFSKIAALKEKRGQNETRDQATPVEAN